VSNVEELLQLSRAQMSWLVCRLECSTDAEAITSLQVKKSTVDAWKQKRQFYNLYTQVLSPTPDLIRDFVLAIESLNALVAAREKLALIDMPWEGLQAREASAKSSLMRDTLDRVAPKNQRPEASEESMKEIIMEGNDA